MDPDGWSYAFDFIFLEFPPAVASDKPGTGTFVRRRRWVRHRVPTSNLHKFPESAAPQSAAVAQRALATATAAGAAAAVVGAEGGTAIAEAVEVPAVMAASPRLSRRTTPVSTTPQQHRWIEPGGRGEGSSLGRAQSYESYEAVVHGNARTGAHAAATPRMGRAERAAHAVRRGEEHAQSSPPVAHAHEAASGAGGHSTPRAQLPPDPPERRLTPLERKKMVRSTTCLGPSSSRPAPLRGNTGASERAHTPSRVAPTHGGATSCRSASPLTPSSSQRALKTKP